MTKISHIGNVQIKDDMYVIKKNNNLDSIFEYLMSRGFHNFPTIIESNDKLITKYEEDTAYPEEQKLNDLIKLTGILHQKTVYTKDEDTYYSDLINDIENNLIYLNEYYEQEIIKCEGEVFMRPSSFLLAKNYTIIKASLFNASKKLEELKTLKIKKYRQVVGHNNLEIGHYIRNTNEFLVSWDKAKFQSPIIDVYKLIRKYEKYDPFDLISRYEKTFPLNQDEKKILLIMLSMPELINSKKELNRTVEIRKIIDNIERFLPYNTENSPHQQNPEKET